MSPRSGTEEAAHRYADAGWPVMPAIPGEKVPATAHGLLDASTSHQAIEKWWSRNPERNVAIATGAPGPDVLDIDKHGDQSGFPALHQLKEAGLVGDPGAMVRTPNNGAHLYFKGTEHQRNGHIESAHVDFRSNGGYVVAPPSQVNGRPYVVVSHQPSADTFNWSAAKQHLEPERSARREWAPSPDAGPRNLDHLVRYVGECDDHVNDRLYWAACRMAEAGQHDRLPELIQAAYGAGEDRQGQAEKTVESALRTVRPEPQREAG